MPVWLGQYWFHYFAGISLLGCLTSQSLISLTATIGAIATVWLCSQTLKEWRTLDFTQKLALCLPLLLCSYTILNSVLRPWTSRTTNTFEMAPFALILTLPFFYAQKRLGKPISRGTELAWGAAYAMGVGAVVYQSLYLVFVRDLIATGFFKSPIVFAHAMLPAMLLGIELCIRGYTNSKTARALFGVGGFVLLALVLMANTRGAQLAVLSYVFCRGIALAWNNKLKWWHAAAGLGFAGLGLGLWLRQAATNRDIWAKVTNFTLWSSPSIQIRLELWHHNWMLWLQNPLFGVGFENNGVDTALTPLKTPGLSPGYLHFAHSVYFQSLADSGLVGVALLAALFWILWKQCSQLWIWIVVFMVAGLTDNLLNNSKVLANWVFMAALFMILCSKFTGGSKAQNNLQNQ